MCIGHIISFLINASMKSITITAPVPARSNDASVLAFVHSNSSYIPGPYTLIDATSPGHKYVPSLAWFCILKLQKFVDQVAVIGNVRLHYRPAASASDFDLLRALFPSLGQPEFNWALVDPRLWATIVQIYDNLPSIFECYPIPLADEHLPLLQLAATPNFSLITILELPGPGSQLSDATIVGLKQLHCLCALDASATQVSSHGVKVLAGTVLWSDGEKKGPWGLRVLRLGNCKAIDDKVVSHLSAFPLLCVLDLRGTQCISETFQPTFKPAPVSEHALYHPTPLRTVVELLRSSSISLFSSQNVFILHINALYYAPPANQVASHRRNLEDVCVTFTPGSSQCIVSSSAQLPSDRKRFRRRLSDQHDAEDCDCRECVGTPLRVNYPAHSPVESSLQEMIAGEELSAHAAANRIASFYGVGTVRDALSTPHFSSRVHHYPSGFLASSEDDRLLMLYRPPPPWSILDSLSSPLESKPVTRASDVITISSRRMAQMTDYAEQFAEKRRKTQRDAIAQPTSSTFGSVALSNNPFRKKPKELKVALQPQVKPLKAITSLATPLLPQELQRAASKSKDESRLQPQKKPAAFDWNKWGQK
ncbi:hypothetical protein C8F01DRAFT_1229897 [Mycena amicta]|nr:hypothetical protein C8F01DRAFT_1229897 [Mycena amicta]